MDYVYVFGVGVIIGGILTRLFAGNVVSKVDAFELRMHERLTSIEKKIVKPITGK